MSECNENGSTQTARLAANITKIKEIICEIPGRRGNEALASLHEILAEFSAIQNKLIANEVFRIRVNEQIGELGTILKQQQDNIDHLHRLVLSLEEHINEQDGDDT